MDQEPMSYSCGTKGQSAYEYRSEVVILPTCIYCCRADHTAENCFIKRSNEVFEEQNVKFAKNCVPTEAERARLSGQHNVMIVKENAPIEEENTVAALKRSAD